MTCAFCEGTNRVARVSECGSRIDVVTCPRCIRGVSVLGTHEMLRSKSGIHMPGERVPTGTVLSGLIV